jgi:DHA1 family inner membrane transport protein
VVSMNFVGRWSDRSGKLKVFAITSLSCAVPILLVTNLPRVAQGLSTVLPALVVVGLPRLALALACTTLMMICMSSRMVPAMAMMTAAVQARDRGGFMSINSAVQQFSMFLASLATGAIVREAPDGKLINFPLAGLISIACAYTCIYLARYLKVPAKTEAPGEPVLVEM